MNCRLIGSRWSANRSNGSSFPDPSSVIVLLFLLLVSVLRQRGRVGLGQDQEGADERPRLLSGPVARDGSLGAGFRFGLAVLLVAFAHLGGLGVHLVAGRLLLGRRLGEVNV